MITHHTCPTIPRNIRITYDPHPSWGWCMETTNDFINVKYCCFCGEELKEDIMDNYVIFKKNLNDSEGNLLFKQGKKYELLLEEDGKYFISHMNAKRTECTSFSVDQRGILFEVISNN